MVSGQLLPLLVAMLNRILMSRPMALTIVVAIMGLFALVVTGPRSSAQVVPQVQHLSDQAAVQVVAHLARSPGAARQIVVTGQAHRNDGMWYVTVDGAHFHFRETTRIVLPEDEPAAALLLGPELSP